mgnify:CR=1 FL=1
MVFGFVIVIRQLTKEKSYLKKDRVVAYDVDYSSAILLHPFFTINENLTLTDEITAKYRKANT